jgi:hypothetical protein
VPQALQRKQRIGRHARAHFHVTDFTEVVAKSVAYRVSCRARGFLFLVMSLSGSQLSEPVVRKNSCRDLFQPVFMMQSAQDSLASHSMALRKSVSML